MNMFTPVRKRWLLALGLTVLVAACQQKSGNGQTNGAEDGRAKALLQGVWVESETNEVSFCVRGDSVFFPDSTSQPAAFRIVADSFLLGGVAYPIEKQSEHVFWFRNRNGEVVKLQKSADATSELTFDRQPKTRTFTLGEFVKLDSVVMFGAQRYHWYVAVNPTRYKVQKTTYNDDGMAVANTYYDNIINVTLYQGARRLFSRDFRKQMYAAQVPARFLSQAVLGSMQYDHIDARGFHFNATLCIPDDASCYLVETLIGFDGEVVYKLLEY